MASDNQTPEFAATPLWLHPLTPLSYRGEQARGIFVYRPYDLVRFDENPYVARLKPEERRWCREFVLPFAERVEAGSNAVRVVTHGLAEYTPRTSWTMPRRV